MNPSVSEKKPRLLTKTMIILVLGAITLLVYWRVQGFQFVNFDDDVHVYENPYVTSGLTRENILWAFGIHGPSQWHPLAWVSHQLDCELFGLWPGGHHLTNLSLHVGSVVLLFLFLAQTTGNLGPSAFVAALFAVHPLNVESVAWISERRNVLSLFFGLLTLLAYALYVRNRSLPRYVLVLLAFALALMSKPLVVTLPIVLLLLDYWPFERIRLGTLPHPNLSQNKARQISLLLLEKIPLLLLAIGASVLTLWCQEGSIASRGTLPLHVRFLNSLAAYAIYLRKALWPSDLGVFYPHPGFVAADPISELLTPAIVGGSLLVLITIWVVWAIRKHPYCAVGWFWFLGVLVPMIGLIQVGQQQLADRYMYLPMIGLLIAGTWLAAETARAMKIHRSWLRLAGVTFVIVCALISTVQVRHWQDSITLFEHTLAVTERNSLAHNNLGLALSKRHRAAEAAEQFALALRIDPHYGLAHYNLGVVLQDNRRPVDAIAEFQEALRLMPDHVASRTRLGIAFADLGELDLALAHLQESVELAPQIPDSHLNLGIALSRQGKTHEAIRCFRRALDLDPKNVKSHYHLGLALSQMGKSAEAESHFLRVIELVPDFAFAYAELGKLLLAKGDKTGAVRQFRRALEIQPNLRDAQHNLERALAP